ncbi:fungal-specific transcription factor domain-containing protein [Aspergillus desertorum]
MAELLSPSVLPHSSLNSRLRIMEMDPRLRSCTLCRQRKVKCDRQQPCSNCTRADTQCVFPPGLGRAPKRPRKAVEARLLAQLSRLEAVVKRMEQQSPDSTYSTAPHPPSDGGDSKIEQGLGRLVIDEVQSCYVSSAQWSQLGDEIGELRDLLHRPSSDEDEDGPSIPELKGSGPNSALLGYRALTHSLKVYHPSVRQAVALFDVFKANVAPLVHIFHMPTLDQLFWDAVASMDSIDRNIEALLFAVYYAAAISLDSAQCLDIVGLPRSSALEIYRFAVEQAAARADLLNTQNLTLLQATVLFLTALRNEDDSRTVWSLTALVYHVAQAMGLHRDGQGFGLRPLETELRRRLWWHICLLDNRSTDYHGTEPIVHESTFDTRMPLNINDADLTAEMTQSPVEREGVAEMTFCLMRCHTLRVVWRLGYMAPHSKFGSAAADSHLDSTNREALAEELERLLQDRYLRYCDTSLPFLRLTVSVARIITLRLWTTILSPRCHTDNTVRERLFNISVQLLQLSNDTLTREEMRQWAWHCKTHVQWYATAFLLGELCRRPPSPQCDHAWECVTALYERWRSMETEKRGPLWRSIRRLMARAKYIREVQATASNPSRTGTAYRWRVPGEATATIKENVLPTVSAPASEPQDQFWGLSLATEDPLMDMLGFFSETNWFPGAPGETPGMNILSSVEPSL